MKRTTPVILAGLSIIFVSTSALAVDVVSLRGETDLDNRSEPFPVKRTMAVDGGIDENWKDQPPLIPHSIDKDRISLRENSCLRCHSRVDAKVENAPKPPKSHFIQRNGEKSKTIVAGRYFCTQCHVPQANAQPLVKNTYGK